MSEAHRNEITLREAKGPNPPDLLAEIVKTLTQEIHGLVPDAAESGRSWLRGKGEQELAKANEIKARVIAEIGKLAHEGQRLRDERDKATAELEARRNKDEREHEREMYRLQTERMTAKATAMREAVAIIKEMQEAGIVVELKVVVDLLLSAGGSSEHLPPAGR